MSAKQTTKAAPAQSAEKKAPPVPRKDVKVRVKTKATGAKRTNSGTIFTNEWKYLTLDDKGSAYKSISDDPALIVELAAPPAKPATADEPGKEAK